MARRRAPRAGRVGGEVAYDETFDRDRPIPTPLFPDFKPNVSRSPSETERRQVSALRHLHDLIHNGPFYSHLDETCYLPLHSPDGHDISSAKLRGTSATKVRESSDPFRGMAKYSQRYTKSRRTMPSFERGQHALDLFPRELWGTLDVRYRGGKGATAAQKAARAKASMPPPSMAGRPGRRLTAGEGDYIDERERDEDEGEEYGDRVKPGNSRLDRVTDGDGEEGRKNTEGGAQAGEQGLDEDDVDDEFDDEEDAGDYDAEQYFDDGDEDRVEDFEGGGEASGYFD